MRGDSPGKNTGVGCHALLQGTLPTQGLNPDLPHCRLILYHLSHQGSLKCLLLFKYVGIEEKFRNLCCCCCCCSVVQSCFQPHWLYPAWILSSWDFPGKNTGVGCSFLLQEIAPTQGSKSCLLHWQTDSLPLIHLGKPRTPIEITKCSHSEKFLSKPSSPLLAPALSSLCSWLSYVCILFWHWLGAPWGQIGPGSIHFGVTKSQWFA